MAFLSGNALKILAALFMTADHAGLLLFPDAGFLRILGRLAYPIFAFMIAEGCRYTRNRRRYFGMIFALAVVCQTVYFLVDGSMYLSILFTFSLAILVIYSLQTFRAHPSPATALLPAAAVAGVFLLNRAVTVDYGFWGSMAPVLAALNHGTKYDRREVSVALLGLGLLCLSADMGGIQYYSLLALPLLFAYNGTRGKRKLKYFFYIFYPLHLAVLQGLALLRWS